MGQQLVVLSGPFEVTTYISYNCVTFFCDLHSLIICTIMSLMVVQAQQLIYCHQSAIPLQLNQLAMLMVAMIGNQKQEPEL